VRPLPTVDSPFPPGAPHGTRALGAAYERRVESFLRVLVSYLGWELHSHPWLRHNGQYIQPDFIMQSPADCLLVIEAKLTWIDCSGQLAKYRDMLESIGFQVTTVQVVKNLTPFVPEYTSDFLQVQNGGLVHLWV
jgi:hypothetical protein